MATLEFTKMHGCGNDYIYLVAMHARPADPSALSVKLSDRHFGVGSDGLIMLAPSSNADIRMEMYNADGSRSAMCGNGIRCLARLAFERGLVRANPMVVETDAGLKTVELRLEHHRVVGATVDMGEPILEGRDIPVDAVGRIIDYPLDVAGMRESITALSMGNPHCVVFVADDGVFKLQDRDFAELGRKFEHHPFFPRRVNTEFIMAVSRRNLRMRVWERGSGETWACGTGACAAVVAAVLTNHSERTATVELRGGNLEIEWRAEGADANHVFMTGDAVEVYRGEIELSAGEMVPVS
ncbi:MAG: diaminopimelate epimerase [Candidatus Binatus sp.]|jgi:diaminopimelate epimerase|uniref:diaminopimelate epimerase n=1 Tax=Candidatus Binatus sp. TaxID=2811406 RepID=UPI003D097C13